MRLCQVKNQTKPKLVTREVLSQAGLCFKHALLKSNGLCQLPSPLKEQVNSAELSSILLLL